MCKASAAGMGFAFLLRREPDPPLEDDVPRSAWTILMPTTPALTSAGRAPARAAQWVQRRDGTVSLASIDARLAQAATHSASRGR
jgi:hypothetical protein